MNLLNEITGCQTNIIRQHFYLEVVFKAVQKYLEEDIAGVFSNTFISTNWTEANILGIMYLFFNFKTIQTTPCLLQFF